jgi:hypothetical protein
MNTEHKVGLPVLVEVSRLYVAVVIGQGRKFRVVPSGPRALSIAEENLRHSGDAARGRQYQIRMAVAVHVRNREPLPPLTLIGKTPAERR